MKKRKMSALQKKYFSKRKKIRATYLKPKRKRVYMARRKKYFSRGGIKAGLGGALPAVAGGAGDVIVKKFIPINGVGSVLSGMFLKDSITQKIGFNKVGESLGAMFFGNGGSNGNGGWL